jgi:hypothetical protein
LARSEAIERAEAEREAAERAARIEERHEAWMWRRMQQMAWRGEPFDPSDPSTLAQPLDEFIAETFAASDREADRLDRAALRDAGLLHSLGPRFADEPPSGAGELVPSAPATAAASASVARARWALHRITHRATPCACVDCVAVRAAKVAERAR